MDSNNKVLNMIFLAIDEMNEVLTPKEQLTKSEETVLYGSEGKIDSLGLINLIIMVEQNIEDEFNHTITLANEKAMSQKHSPFRTIGTLADYIDMLLKEIQNSE
tara:strand:+ start:687 stop:998 length:312 start_codon:yes stop_codon:yes gene_type:complete